MTNYSICYLDAAGRTESSEFLPFEDNRSATDFARIGIVGHAIVEVWKSADLVVRLYRDAPPAVVAGAPTDNAARSFERADNRKSLDAWDNEGGGARPQISVAAR
jgi:hypothetical protein